MASNKKKTTTVTTKKKKTICPTTKAAAGITKSMEEQVAELFANMKAKDAQIESLLEEKQQRGTCNALLIPSPSMCVLTHTSLQMPSLPPPPPLPQRQDRDDAQDQAELMSQSFPCLDLTQSILTWLRATNLAGRYLFVPATCQIQFLAIASRPTLARSFASSSFA
jgi:hypothetical protein